MMETIETTPVRAQNIKQWTDKEPILSQVHKLVMTVWQETTNPEIQPYWKRRDGLSICDGCILWEHRVTVHPPRWKLMHTSQATCNVAHPGVSRMKMKTLKMKMKKCSLWSEMESRIVMTVK